MNTTKLRIVRRAYGSRTVDPELNRINQRKWVVAMRILGDKWLLATPVQRKTAKC
jgi:hypothetical protein